MTMHHADTEIEYVTATVCGQLFGLPIARVLDVFIPERITRVPLAAPEVAGVLNLRGRIVTAIDMRRRLGLPPRGPGDQCMAIGIERDGEFYGLLVDQVGEVMRLSSSTFEAVPVNLDPSWARLALGVHRLEGRLLVALDVDRSLDLHSESVAA
ncbi:MAG: chemotaxis protein CheW [Bradyrhizobiaceae bacterium]|nr:chemotaxis protein CheW [Bradyrhizobiaceae bacterium]